MNEDTRSAVQAVDGHPDENRLLLALERELPVEEATQVEQHLGNCWSCRARSDEMRRGILAFVEYREKRYLPSLPVPPDHINDFRDRLRTLVKETMPLSWTSRMRRYLQAVISLPRNVKWASAVATAMAIVVVWVQVVVNPPALSATELLNRAVAAQRPPASRKEGASRRVVRQKVRIGNGVKSVIRDFEWRLDGRGVNLGTSQPDPWAWSAPLTAESFAAWRNSLAEKTDAVKTTSDLLTLETRTTQNPIKQAQIVVRAADFHPVAQHLLFQDDRQLDFTELAFEIVEEARPESQSEVRTGAPAAPSAKAAPPAAVDLDEAELELRYLLFANHWDLGEDLQIARAAGRVTLSGTVSSPEREEAMRAALTALPNVQLSLDRPAGSAVSPGGANGTASKDPGSPTTPLLKDTLDHAFPSREERLAFVDRCLALSDTALSHVWAIKELIGRYGLAEALHLKPESESKLREMLQVHVRELDLANNGLEAFFGLLPATHKPSETRGDSSFQVDALLSAVQRQDRLLATLLLGSQERGFNLTAVSADIQASHSSIRAMVGSFKDRIGVSPK